MGYLSHGHLTHQFGLCRNQVDFENDHDYYNLHQVVTTTAAADPDRVSLLEKINKALAHGI